ncbi:MAG TPA: glycoside hydrolase family 97 protein [Candidatus Sulfopaludibacter sp.]|jgi:alpha-glucosidase|nr:glycoside hydrolase family 97 protein [Candidatus Sulfopaludibacter sp.]
MRRVLGIFLAVAGAWGQGSLKSPDGAIEMTISADRGLAYTVSFHGNPVILRSTLGLELAGQPVLGASVRILQMQPGSLDETYSMPTGKANPIHSVCRTLTVELEETAAPSRKMTLEARAFNDGVAFRYRVPDQPGVKEIRLAGERTQFKLAKDGTTWPLILENFQTPYEDNYRTLPVSGIHADSLVGLPLLSELPGVAWVGITEAHIENYAGMYLQRNTRDALVLASRLSPSVDDATIAVRTTTPMQSPWRVILIASEPGRLIESNIVTDLNPPPAFSDTSWIKPGKTAWDWWSGSYAEGVPFKTGMNTATMEHYIDFCAESGLPYMLIDAGWAAKGTGQNDSGTDLTHTIAAIDMPAILDYARKRNVRIWLWAHWSDVEREMQEAFPLFERWGVAGVKIDFMNRDDQWMVDYYHRVVKLAAEHHLMIDFHGAYKPDGMRRTWPNLITRESVMGAEYNKWSGRVTPEHNVTLPFTRMLAGPLDYTPGGFNNATAAEFKPQNTRPMVMTTRAHQLALYVILETGLQMLADYPEIYKGQKELQFLRDVPVVWNETRVVAGRPGDYVTIARRNGREWYVGSITASHAKELDIPLEFLGKGEFLAEVYSDAPDAATDPKHTTKAEQRVTAATVLHVKLAPAGGQAIRIRPAQ